MLWSTIMLLALGASGEARGWGATRTHGSKRSVDHELAARQFDAHAQPAVRARAAGPSPSASLPCSTNGHRDPTTRECVCDDGFELGPDGTCTDLLTVDLLFLYPGFGDDTFWTIGGAAYWGRRPDGTTGLGISPGGTGTLSASFKVPEDSEDSFALDATLPAGSVVEGTVTDLSDTAPVLRKRASTYPFTFGPFAAATAETTTTSLNFTFAAGSTSGDDSGFTTVVLTMTISVPAQPSRLTKRQSNSLLPLLFLSGGGSGFSTGDLLPLILLSGNYGGSGGLGVRSRRCRRRSSRGFRYGASEYRERRSLERRQFDSLLPLILLSGQTSGGGCRRSGSSSSFDSLLIFSLFDAPVASNGCPSGVARDGPTNRCLCPVNQMAGTDPTNSAVQSCLPCSYFGSINSGEQGMCGLSCPANATPSGTTCSCQIAGQVYNSSANACQTPTPVCTTNQTLNAASTACVSCASLNRLDSGAAGSCGAACPATSTSTGAACNCGSLAVYSASTNSCTTTCPAGSVPNTARTACQCTALSTTLNDAVTACVSCTSLNRLNSRGAGTCGTTCPASATSNGATCVCPPLFAFNAGSNSCETTCPAGSSPSAGACRCTAVNTTLDSAGNTCISCTAAGQLNSGTAGTCGATCPATSTSTGTTCTCPSLTTYNAQSNACDSTCPTGSAPSGGVCRCSAVNTVLNSAGTACVSCATAGQLNSGAAGSCGVACPATSTSTGTTCSCPAPYSYNAQSNSCDSTCPAGSAPSGSVCRCSAVNTTLNPGGTACISCTTAGQLNSGAAGTCGAPCPSGAVSTGAACSCPTLFVYNAQSNTCDSTCPAGTSPSGTVCRCDGVNTTFNPLSAGPTCVSCADAGQLNSGAVGSCGVACPPSSTSTGTTCTCPALYTYNAGSNTCDSTCPTGSAPSGGQCRCTAINTYLEPETNSCIGCVAGGYYDSGAAGVCSVPTCVPGEAYDRSTRACECSQVDQIRDQGTCTPCNDLGRRNSGSVNSCGNACPTANAAIGYDCVPF